MEEEMSMINKNKTWELVKSLKEEKSLESNGCLEQSLMQTVPSTNTRPDLSLKEIKQSKNKVLICQKKYTKDILKKFQMDECKATSTPMNQKEKPDIMFAASLLSRFMHCASEMNLRAAKRILRYIKGTVDYSVKFEICQNLRLYGFSDNDWARSIDDMKSTSGYYFSLGSRIFLWSSKKQKIVAQSIAEAEFIAATATANQNLWLKKMMRDLHLE
ncbi:hypothetical protein CXB51_031329 [Gossypium anomalum]|uniref:Reverse transcriptase Ty1/copia-type domain-containing protein n=1 Tax=Gossypium anomalum TaxID=47600 RepID=A0A8J5YBT7_9ROSI|nr:hypothetical protein CXB51_031329 [Gossypium anomalum]